VTVLSLVLAFLLTLWCVGTILLVRYGPDLPELPTPTPTVTTDR
jgi:hypothetical protein